MPRPACEPGIFCFSFIFSPEQFLRPFGYCATLRILSERFKPFFQSSHFLKQHLPISGRSPIFQELAPRERKRLIVQNRPQHQIWAFRWTGLGSKNNHGSHQCLLNFSNIFQNWQFDRRLSCNLNPFTIATLPNSPTTNTLIVFLRRSEKMRSTNDKVIICSTQSIFNISSGFRNQVPYDDNSQKEGVKSPKIKMASKISSLVGL